MDSYRRELHLSLGCALENMMLLAQARGYAPQLNVVPGRVDEVVTAIEPTRVAGIDLHKSNTGEIPDMPRSLCDAIPHRHTNRGPYRADREVPETMLGALRRHVDTRDVKLLLLTDAAARQDFASATCSATEAIVGDAKMIADSDAWFRDSDADIAKHRDGVTLYAAGLSPLMLTLARILPSASPQRQHQEWIENTRHTQLGSNPAIGLIAVRDLHDREQALQAGRLWQRLHLQGTTLGLGMQPLNQLPECVDRERQLGRPANYRRALTAFTGDEGWLPTFAFRLGWPTQRVYASPRRDLSSVILTS